jgi:uncharacterized membrane protein YdjX (TVP38/TMEM64 family)
MRGARGRRRLPPLPLADADPAAPLHRDNPRPQQLRAGRGPGGARGGGASRRRRRPPLRPRGPAAKLKPRRRPLPLAEIGITLAGIALLAGLVVAVPALREAVSAAIQGNHDEVRREIDRLGAAGPLLILALALIHTVVFYPAEIVDAAAGYAYGFFPALALMMLGWMLSGFACWGIGGSVARPLLDRWLGEERFERAEAMIERGGVTLMLAMRLIPILPFSIVSYAAGAARVPAWRFAWTTAIGYLPITAISVYFGTRLEGLSLTDPLVFGSAAAILALLLLGHWAMRRQSRRGAPE